MQYGILAGSLSSGEVVLWDPNAIINQAAANPAIHTWKPSGSGQVFVQTCSFLQSEQFHEATGTFGV